jgi:crotonobetainyl-CoA:carnitine CoA-transferase CaiB-like acyl-CoA transferase
MSQPLPLEGIQVVDYSHYLAGPHMSRCLAAMGADVIKVERPNAGDPGRASPTIVKGQSGYFLQQNMGKRGLCVNLKDPRGLDLMHRLADGAHSTSWDSATRSSRSATAGWCTARSRRTAIPAQTPSAPASV